MTSPHDVHAALEHTAAATKSGRIEQALSALQLDLRQR
jgi:hypothetical protein